MITNYLNTDWHGVPAGTALTIIERVVQVNGGKCFRVSRADGLDLPGPFESSTAVALVGEEFVSVSASYDFMPDGVPDWMRRSVAEARDRLPQAAYIIDGVIFWRSNDRPVPVTFFGENFISLPAAQYDADMASQRAAIEAYRKARENISPEQAAEEAFERRVWPRPDGGGCHHRRDPPHVKPRLDYGREPIRRQRKINIYRHGFRQRANFLPRRQRYALGTLVAFTPLPDHDPFKGWRPQLIIRDRFGDRAGLPIPGTRLTRFRAERKRRPPHFGTFADRAPRVHARGYELRMWVRASHCYGRYKRHWR